MDLLTREKAVLRSHVLSDTTHSSRQPFAGSTTILLTYAVADYHRFKALGPGGVPHNILAWLIVTLFLRPLAHSKRGTTNVNDFPATGASQEVFDLPGRKGERPDVGEIIPQRQLSQNAGSDMTKVGLLLFDMVAAV